MQALVDPCKGFAFCSQHSGKSLKEFNQRCNDKVCFQLLQPGCREWIEGSKGDGGETNWETKPVVEEMVALGLR